MEEELDDNKRQRKCGDVASKHMATLKHDSIMADHQIKSRNLCEKKRRDHFNTLVNELSTMVCSVGRKMDKSSVLKSTIAFLKNHNETTVRSRIHDIEEEWKPSFINNEEFTHLILDALESFIMVFSATGHIKFVSESVTSLLGHIPCDILNKSIFDLAYDEDRPSLYNLLQNPGTSVDAMQAIVLKENQIKFQCHIRRGTLDYREEPAYELVQFIGYFRSSSDNINSETKNSQGNHSRLLFVCTGRLELPQLIRDVSPMSSEHCEFTSRHSLEWKYLFLDHRAPSIIGYLPFEVLGTSGYDYYHLDDLEKLATCHESLMQKGELTSCYYRFLTKGQQWIWLQTRFYITYHQWNSKPEFVVCTHRVVRYADVVVKSEKVMEVAKVEEMVEDAVTEADVSMGDVSPSYVSESSEDYERHRGSIKSMSATSGAGSGAEGSQETSGSRAAKANSLSNNPETSASMKLHFDGYAWKQTARQRYGGSDSGSLASTSTGGRRRQPHDPNRSASSDCTKALVSTKFVELPQPPYAISVPVVDAPIHMQLQEHLQRKHEELQQLIVMQQEELRRIAEQMMMARLGILPPMLNVQYGDMLNGGGQPQIMFEVSPSHLDPTLQPSNSLHLLPGLNLPPQSVPTLNLRTPPLIGSNLHATVCPNILQKVPPTPTTSGMPQYMPVSQLPNAHMLRTPQLPQTPQIPQQLQVPQTSQMTQASQLHQNPQMSQASQTQMPVTPQMSQASQLQIPLPSPMSQGSQLQIPLPSPMSQGSQLQIHLAPQISQTLQMPQTPQMHQSPPFPQTLRMVETSQSRTLRMPQALRVHPNIQTPVPQEPPPTQHSNLHLPQTTVRPLTLQLPKVPQMHTSQKSPSQLRHQRVQPTLLIQPHLPQQSRLSPNVPTSSVAVTTASVVDPSDPTTSISSDASNTTEPRYTAVNVTYFY